MKILPINLQKKFSLFTDHWFPKFIAQMNDVHFKLTKIKGDFIWHRHAETDEVFIIYDGRMSIEFRSGKVNLNTGDMFVVPKGVEHKPMTQDECSIILVEPAGTVNTGETGGDMTAEENAWI